MSPPRARRLVAHDSVHAVSTPDRPADAGPPARDLVDIPAGEVISRAAVMLMSAAAEQLGLGAADPERPEHRDLAEARILITALAEIGRAHV